MFLKPTASVPSTVQPDSVPEEGVPKTPPFATKAPEEPTFTANAVATFVPSPDTPVLIGSPVAFVRVADVGVPRTGVTSVGEVANTKDPVPVSSVTAARRLFDEGVPSQVATPEPNDVIPVPPEATGRAAPRVTEGMWLIALTTFVPSA